MGGVPPIPSHIKKSRDSATVALRSIMHDCYKFKPENRPTAKEIVKYLDREIEEIGANYIE